MKVLQLVSTALTASIDIETVRVKDKFEDLDEGTQSAWEYKNKQDGKIPDNDELADLWERNSALYAEFSKVCAVSLTYLDPTGKPVCKEFYGENELKLLKALGVTLNNMMAYNKDYRLVGHASKYFDYPYLCKRYIINGLDIPQTLDSTLLKPWEYKNLCTNELWKMAGTGAGSSLQALCNALQIPISKVDLVGDAVGAAYYNREFFRIGRYCSLDTIATFNVVRKLKKESIFSFEEVNYITAYSEDGVVEKEEEIELPLLQKIYKAVNIDEVTKAKIEEKLAKKKLTKKEKTIVEDILTSLYVNSAMFQSDKPEIKQRKINEIKEILNATA